MSNTAPPALKEAHNYAVAGNPENPRSTEKYLLKDGQYVPCHKISPALMPKKIQRLGHASESPDQYDNFPLRLCNTQCLRARIMVDEVAAKAYYCVDCEVNPLRVFVGEAKIEGQNQL
jgi:hypothetical protein